MFHTAIVKSPTGIAAYRSTLACVFSYLRSLWCQIASGQIFNMDAIGELANLLMVRMLVIRKRGVTAHLTWPSLHSIICQQAGEHADYGWEEVFCKQP